MTLLLVFGGPATTSTYIVIPILLALYSRLDDNLTLAKPSDVSTQLYMSRVIDLVGAPNVFRLWMQSEPGGTTLTDYSPNNANKAGAYAGVTLGAAGSIAGYSAAGYDGATSATNIYTAAFGAGFNTQEGTLMAWSKVANAGVWTDGILRYVFNVRADVSNRIYLAKSSVINRMDAAYIAGGTSKIITFATSDTPFVNYALTWSVSADTLRFFQNGAQIGADVHGLGAWVGAPASNACALGSAGSAPASVYNGTLGPMLLASRAINPVEVLNLSALMTDFYFGTFNLSLRNDDALTINIGS